MARGELDDTSSISAIYVAHCLIVRDRLILHGGSAVGTFYYHYHQFNFEVILNDL